MKRQHATARWAAAASMMIALFAAPAALAEEAGGPAALSIHQVYGPAVAGNMVAQRQLGIIYLKGTGVPANPQEAARWFRRAAERGDAAAAWQLAELYRTGLGVPRNPAEAARWEQRAAGRGDPAAQVAIAKGYLAESRYREAETWFRKAADGGDIEAQQQLIMLYVTGAICDCEYGGLDYHRGMGWVRELAEKGVPVAQWGLALYSERGPKNHRDAYVWYMLAAASGIQEAEQRAIECATQLSAAQRASARAEIVRRWKRLNP